MLNQIYYKSKNYLLSRTKFFTKSRYALPFIFLVCFVEAIIFPFPQEIFMIPMMASEKAKIFKIAFFSLCGSILGGILAYFIGMFLFDSLGTYILNLYNLNSAFNKFTSEVSNFGFIYVFIGGFTPIPFKVITLSSGFIGINFLVFILASIISRFARFYIIGFIIWKYGESFMIGFEKRLTIYSFIFISIIILTTFIILN